MKFKIPPYLKVGDTIAIVAPAGIIKNKETITKAKALAESWGLKVVYGKHLFYEANHFAGTDTQRCKDFQEALNDKNIKAIWSARGGYGTVRILDQLDFTAFEKAPKWLIGYSDVTAFHNHIHNLNIETLHGMMASSMQDAPEAIFNTIKSLKETLFGKSLSYEIPASKYNKVGEVSGRLIGGNIAILTSMLGSESQINTNGKILFLEEIGEYKYAIDRMLQSLKRAGYFTNVKGIIVGGMTNIKRNTTSWGSSIEEMILALVPNNIPVLFDFPAGHDKDNRALIMGRELKLIIAKNEVSKIIFNA